MRRVLVIYFSQTGQLERIVRSVLAPLVYDERLSVQFVPIHPRRPYPFPWSLRRFFDQFPECVYLDPPEIEPLPFDPSEKFDLVVLGYQPWFLAPSPPATAFLQSRWARVLDDSPVVTIIGARNMWLMAQESVRGLVASAGGRIVGNIALIDPGSPASTFVTTPLWMLTGFRSGIRPWLPAAGIDDASMTAARVHGEELLRGLLDGRVSRGEAVLDAASSAPANPRYVVAERFGRRSFHIWGRLVRTMGPQGAVARLPVLVVYAIFLVCAILTVVPLTVVARRLLGFLPAYRRWMDSQISYFQQYGQVGVSVPVGGKCSQRQYGVAAAESEGV